MDKGIDVRINITNIQFSKLDLISSDDVNSKMSYDYSFKYSDDLQNATVKIEVRFQFAPEILIKGIVEYELEINSNEKEVLNETIIKGIIDRYESRIASEVSYLVTVCIDMVHGMKVIVPPLLVKD